MVTNATVKRTNQPEIVTSFDTNSTYAKNTGHGLQLFETSPISHEYNASDANGYDVDTIGGGSKCFSMIGGSKYNFYQVHWHTPSENTVDGKSFAMEAHFVHQLDDPALHGTYHRLAVIGLLYELGTDEECNSVLDKFWAEFPMSKGIAEYTGSNPDFNAKLSEELAQGYYHWYGSLTTPPCTEGVSWNLLKITEKVCQRQVNALKTALKGTQHLEFNNRVTQPLYHRQVTDVDNITPTPTTQAPATPAPTAQGTEETSAAVGATGMLVALLSALASTILL